MKIIIPFFLAALLGAAGYMLFEQHKTDQRIRDLKAGVNLRRSLDSLRAVTETRIIDSLSADLSRRDKRIDALESKLHKTQKQNAELEKRFNSLRVSMPQF